MLRLQLRNDGSDFLAEMRAHAPGAGSTAVTRCGACTLQAQFAFRAHCQKSPDALRWTWVRRVENLI
jgi:hypothetical protein